jgi:hypothetical protein
VELAAKKKEVEQSEEEIKNLKTRAASKSFMEDILGDDEGVSFHGFQIFAWTIVLTVIFIGKVYHGLSMPDFDSAALALMGISAGTFVGFKLPNQEG